MNWKLCITDTQKNALDLCNGSMDEGDGWGTGCGDVYGGGNGGNGGYGNGWGDGDVWGTHIAGGNGYGDGLSYGNGGGGSPPEWE